LLQGRELGERRQITSVSSVSFITHFGDESRARSGSRFVREKRGLHAFHEAQFGRAVCILFVILAVVLGDFTASSGEKASPLRARAMPVPCIKL